MLATGWLEVCEAVLRTGGAGGLRSVLKKRLWGRGCGAEAVRLWGRGCGAEAVGSVAEVCAAV